MLPNANKMFDFGYFCSFAIPFISRLRDDEQRFKTRLCNALKINQTILLSNDILDSILRSLRNQRSKRFQI